MRFDTLHHENDANVGLSVGAVGAKGMMLIIFGITADWSKNIKLMERREANVVH
jgi:hypothetical protein